ncbi:hypothetical protein PPTG_20916 [Phytophthora nicotianae INRA-310]|uniref:Uncharacterized protein n=1 Tax=Phytophthora nicotianae (strain INRA-310) TaxID=761204 RepID=W2RAG1_PHYN3|nr:hypothetical protein PPTG_20916 [Phytophthora nicotianae INRA-310]ETN22398.1 hypothetical protein PPTG_20916 [Phytophthora nicotianae INRA-310]
MGLPLPDKLQVQLHVKVGQPYTNPGTLSLACFVKTLR